MIYKIEKQNRQIDRQIVTQVHGPGHTEAAVRMTVIAADQPALVQGDGGPVYDVLSVPQDGQGRVHLDRQIDRDIYIDGQIDIQIIDRQVDIDLRDRCLVFVAGPVTGHRSTGHRGGHTELGALDLNLERQINRQIDK